MSLINHTLRGMYNGVSQQPSPLRQDSQFERQINFMSDIVDGVVKRPNTEFVDILESNATDESKVHTIDRSIDEKFKVIFTGDPDNPIEIFDLDGNSYDVQFADQGTEDYVNVIEPRKDIKCLSLSEETFILNTQEVVEKIDPSTVDNVGDMNKTCMAWVKQGLPEIKYRLAIYDKNGDKISEAEVESPSSDTDTVDTTPTDDLAVDIKEALDSNVPSDYNLFVRGSVIFFEYTGSDSWSDVNIKVECSDSYGDQAFISINQMVNDFGELPYKGLEYYPIAVTGNRGIEEGAYYVEFDKDQEIWRETRAIYNYEGDLIPFELNPSTMPRVMTQQDDGSFLIEKADWAENTVGDESTSPMPSFVGETINDIFFYRDRVGFLSRDNIVMTRAGDYFDLFPKTATQVLEQDPIDVSVTSKQVAELRHAKAFSRALIVFSDQTQFAVGSAGTVLAPQTITIDPSTHYETVKDCSPVGVGANIFFGVPKGNYTGIRRYFVQKDTITSDAEDVTGQVPKYIPSGITKMTSSSSYNILFVYTPETPDTIYIYRYQWSNEKQIQSSWSKWTFKNERILDIAVADNYLYLVTKKDGEIVLVKMDLRRVAQDDLPIKIHLDKMVHLQGVYNEEEGYTYFDLPFKDDSDRYVGVDESTGLALNDIEQIDSNTLRTLGDKTEHKYFIGKPYESLIEYSKFYIEDDTGMADVQGKLQLKTLTVSFTNTGEFRLKVTPFSRDNIRDYVEGDEELEEYMEADIINNEHSSIVLGEAVLNTPPVLTGEHTFQVTTNAKKARLELIADTHLPASFQLTAFEAEWTNRATHI